MRFIEELKYLLRALGNRHRQGQRPNVLLFATPRGGSTWLMEIIASQPRMKFYDEPFNVRRADVARAGRFTCWSDLMPEHVDTAKVFAYLDDLTQNRLPHMNPRPFRRQHRLFTDRIVFKIHELEFMADKIRQHLQAQVVYLLRHPIPTSLSRNVYPRLDYFMRSPYYRERYLSEAVWDEVRRIHRQGTDLEKGVLSWCFENVDVLRGGNVSNWTVISYEELLLNPVKCCGYLAERLHLEDMDALLKSIDEPSSNIQMSDQDTHRILHEQDKQARKKKMVMKWRGKIGEAEEHRAMAILTLFGLDVYTAGRCIATRPYLLFEDTQAPGQVAA